ncbi:DnaJ-domain-containing protein [Armillaria mellea]|nr:DnaJ-domain-containing protein [Armillaria mellea]
MSLDNASIPDAYAVLELQEGASLDTVKSAYKKIALRTHPDKKRDNPDATEEFQRVAGAYSTLVQYFDNNHHDSDDYSDVKYYSNDKTWINFYMFLCQSLAFLRLIFGLIGLLGILFREQLIWYHHEHFMPMRESPEEYPEYVQRARESRAEQVAAQERREREDAARRASQERDRECARHLAEQRRKEKLKAKKARAAVQRRQAKQAIRTHLQKAQALRSAVFAAAREGNATKVKAGVWEDEVDAAGGEIKRECEKFVSKKPRDPQETLLHIAALKGDHELVTWLDVHNANPEERNDEGLTAFHIALRNGHQKIVSYFFNAFPPKNGSSKPIYTLPESANLLALALDSRDPEVVWMILDKSLASSEDISKAWSWVTSPEGYNIMLKPNSVNEALSDNARLERYNEIIRLLMRFGRFTQPSTANKSEQEEGDNQWPSQEIVPSASHNKQQKQRRQRTQSQMLSAEGSSSLQIEKRSVLTAENVRGAMPRGRGRGRGRGQVRK